MKLILMLCSVSKAMKHHTNLAFERLHRRSTPSPAFAFYCGIDPP